MLLGAALGPAWAALAPTPPVREVGGVLVSAAVEEFQAGQDVVFALLAVLAALVHAAVLLVRRWVDHPPAAAGALAGAALGSVLGWRLGVALGPAPLAAQERDPPLAPLDLQAVGVLGLWPAVLAMALFAGLLAGGLSAPDRRVHRRRQPHEVRRR